jgi:hypothetical protein
MLENGNEFTLGRAFKKDFINNYLDFLKIKELKDYV